MSSPPDSASALGRSTAMPMRVTTVPFIARRRLWIGLGLSQLAAISLAGWIYVLTRLDARDIDDRGLISIVPPAAFAFLALLSLSFALALRVRPLLWPVLAIHLVALVFMLYGAPAYFEEMPRFVTAWLHAGFSEAIARTGELYPLRDARFDWPGFFVLSALFGSAAKLDSLLPVLPWIPPIQTLLYLPPLALIFRSASDDRRLMWLGLWIFCLTNWVGQDYLSPQGFNILLYLTIIAILLHWFRTSGSASAWPAAVRRRAAWLFRPGSLAPATREAESTPVLTNRQQVGLIAIVMLLIGTSVASHQLTPFALFGSVLALVVTRRISPRGLPMIMLVLLITWLTFRASTFLAGHLAGLVEDIGRPDQFVQGNLNERLVGSPGHVFAVQARLAFTLGVWLLAFVGGLRALFARRLDLALAALAVAPFGLMFLQGYGGEMLLRIYLFSVPFMAYHAATAFLPTPRPAGWITIAAIAVVSVGLATGMMLTRYGNEKADLVTAADYRAVQRTIDLAEPGDLIATVNNAAPAGFAEWEQHRIIGLAGPFLEGDMDAFLDEMNNRRRDGNDAYLLITRGQRSHAELFWDMSDAAWDRRLGVIARELELVYREQRRGRVPHG